MRSTTVPAAALLVAASAAGGGVFGSRVTAPQDPLRDRVRTFATALATVERDYAEPVDTTQLVYGSIDGMLRTLDPHSAFLEPRNYSQLREKQEGHYYGVGLSISVVNGDI